MLHAVTETPSEPTIDTARSPLRNPSRTRPATDAESEQFRMRMPLRVSASRLVPLRSAGRATPTAWVGCYRPPAVGA